MHVRHPSMCELTSKSVSQARMRLHHKAAQLMVWRDHGVPAGALGASGPLPWRRMADEVVGAAGMKRRCVVPPSRMRLGVADVMGPPWATVSQ